MVEVGVSVCDVVSDSYYSKECRCDGGGLLCVAAKSGRDMRRGVVVDDVKVSPNHFLMI